MSKVLGISGSLRSQSYNTALLRSLAQYLPPAYTLELAPIGDIPLYNEEVQKQGWPASVLRLAQDIAQADVVIVATPEYNHSIPGGLKNAIDWLSRLPEQPFKRKTVGIVGVATGRIGTLRAQLHLRQCFQFLESRVLSRPEVLIGSAAQAFKDGVLVDPSCLAVVQDFVLALTEFAALEATTQ